MNESELYKKLGSLTKDKGKWEESIPYVSSLLEPEIFRVLGKRRPGFVRPYIERLRQISETDKNRVVRIHCLGAIKATGSNSASRDL